MHFNINNLRKRRQGQAISLALPEADLEKTFPGTVSKQHERGSFCTWLRLMEGGRLLLFPILLKNMENFQTSFFGSIVAWEWWGDRIRSSL